MAEHQQYDRALKALMDDHATEIVPELLPGSQVVAEQNTELTRTSLRADLVYLITYQSIAHTLHLELQTNIDPDMNYRMLAYHVDLYGRYRLPVISMVIYPFKVAFPEPLFREESVGTMRLDFPYQALCLWKLEAEQFMTREIVSMYTLLPAMKGITAAMLLQAIEAMESRYQQGATLARHLWRFRILLRRSNMLSEQEKQIVKDKMQSYDSLLDNDPDVQERMAKAAAQATAQAKQDMVLIFVQGRFPALVELAKRRTTQLTSEQLDLLAQQLVTAPSEAMARYALGDVAA